ncbi:hypothetical protein VPNG_09854 [Cytospora leucostoma]|uniref:Rhodopsin domain-containing protein n=1 Tax=Cytospora leucostoma TaxID=1230097 RepID=A0A423VIN8_9PEZI|nr:hypothetical protein VPNG_09854 [Cytospora leucostoma]
MSSVEQGRLLQSAAYSIAPTEPKGLGPVINDLIYFFSALAFVITGLRIWVRFCSGQVWGWDDLLAVGGFIVYVPSSVFGILSTRYGLGARDGDVSNLMEIRLTEYFMYFEILYFAASVMTKVSITLTVLRLCEKKPVYRRIAIGNAVMMIVAASAAGAFVLTNCRPFNSYWNPDLGSCTYGSKGLGSEVTVSLIGSAFQMLSDWVSALLPFFIIKDLAMPRRTKISLIFILGLGIMASIAALTRMVFYKYWNRELYPSNYWYHTGLILIFSELEVSLGIIACSLPPLRKLIKNAFHSTSRPRADPRGPGGSNYNVDASYSGNKQSFRGGKTTELARISGSGMGKGEWSRLDDDSFTSEVTAPESAVVHSGGV